MLYAIDAKSYRNITSPKDASLLQEDHNCACDWSHCSGLSFNPSKSHVVCFFRNTVIPHEYKMNGIWLVPQDCCSDLGVMFTSDHSWTEHYKTITKKAYQFLGLICTCRTLTQYVLSSVKNSITCHLFILHWHIYCSPIRRPWFIKNIMLLEGIQCKSTNYILNNYHSDYKTRLISHHLYYN